MVSFTFNYIPAPVALETTAFPFLRQVEFLSAAWCLHYYGTPIFSQGIERIEHFPALFKAKKPRSLIIIQLTVYNFCKALEKS